MKTFVPRFRGLAIQKGSAWTWELIITIGPDGPNDPDPIGMTSKNTFINRGSALADMRKMLPGIMKACCEAMGLPEPTGVQDLKAGTMEDMETWEMGE